MFSVLLFVQTYLALIFCKTKTHTNVSITDILEAYPTLYTRRITPINVSGETFDGWIYLMNDFRWDKDVVRVGFDFWVIIHVFYSHLFRILCILLLVQICVSLDLYIPRLLLCLKNDTFLLCLLDNTWVRTMFSFMITPHQK